MAIDSYDDYIKSPEQISYIVNHVFLPSKVPQQDDYEEDCEQALLNATLNALSNFRKHVQDYETGAVDSIINSLQTLHLSASNEKQLLTAFDHFLIEKHGTIAFHVRRQNAGIMFTRSDASIHIEVFELSADNASVMSTRGRLKRLFPGSALAIPLETFQLPTFRSAISHTLLKMSHQSARGTKSKVKKSGNMHDENRDTTHPKIVTDLLSALLSSLGNPLEVTSICKHTREEVFYKDCKSPWHRSALWLLIRVTLQLQFTRSATLGKCSEQAYKTYMLLFMSEILTRAHNFNLPSDLLSAMNSKLSRRCQKVTGSVPSSIVESVEYTLSATNQILQERWSRIQDKNHLVHDMERLRGLDFEADTHISLHRLDDYINSLSRRGETSDPSSSKVDCPLSIHDSSTAPRYIPPLDARDITYELAAIEAWVSQNLPTWINRNEADPNTCGALNSLIMNYHKAALNHYQGNPELSSIMLLTILELWVASDKSALRNCPLLESYGPGVPHGFLQNLNLPFKEHMERLQKIEKYLAARESQAVYTSYHVFQSFGDIHSFSVQYFNQSMEHLNLRARIERDAGRAREEKRTEFRDKQRRYLDLIRRSEQVEHETIELCNRRGRYYERCAYDCTKCDLEKQADRLEIKIHEWPLPEDELQAKSTVFELRVPHYFGYWRDTTIFIFFDVLRQRYLVEEHPRSENVLKKGLLENHFQGFDPSQRIILLSENKSHTRTHRRAKKISDQTEDDVCLENGLHYRYFDAYTKCFVTEHTNTLEIPDLCTYSIPKQSPGQTSPIQKFINRPASMPDGPSSNTVLASQSDCPGDLSLEEYKALASLPLGSSIQWQNILVQLAMPSIDFKLEQTVLVILQCIFQAGPRKGDELLRQGHNILRDKSFALALLGRLNEALERIKENWQSFQALGVFVALARRLLSLTPVNDIKSECLTFLATTRDVALKWIKALEDKIQDINDDVIRMDLLRKVSMVALICVDTFNVDDEHLHRLLADQLPARIMIRCAIVIQEGLCHAPRATKGLAFIMYQRWEQLSYRGFRILSDQIVHWNNPALNNVIKETWSAFRPNNRWRVLGAPYHHWLETRSAREGGGSLLVHFSLLTGELLIDGSPLSRLPREYEQYEMYSTLFGMSVIEVVPSPVPGMRFSSKRSFNNHNLDFGLNQQGQSLFIRAVTSGKTFEFVPPDTLSGCFPIMFIDNFVHWYNESFNYLEFCARDRPWDHSEKNWRLVRSGATWRLTKGDSILININSDTAARITDVLEPLENQIWTHVILNKSSLALDIELPRLKLGFHMKKGETSISSRQFRGMLVDEDQSIGTLIGLHTKLVLRGRDDRLRRKVIIPSGDISFTRDTERQHDEGQHVRVQIGHRSNTRIHSYEIDDLLGRLINNSSLQSRLLILYLHALTSFPLPDPLTGKTGTENASIILNSAAVRSFKCLTEEDVDLLKQIAALTPRRVYYPENERVMQSVDWSPDLDFLAQHGEFYRTVKSIFKQAKESEFLYPEPHTALPLLQQVDRTLLRRDLLRSSSFRIPGFGAESHTREYDMDYIARDRQSYSPQASHAVALSSMIFEDEFCLRYDINNVSRDHIVKFISGHASGPIYGSTFVLPVARLIYDSEFLITSSSFIAEHWVPLHQLLSNPDIKPDRFQMMFWLGAVAYTKDVDLSILQILASFYAAPEMAHIWPPNVDQFDLSCGFNIRDSNVVGKAVEELCYDFEACPESRWTKRWSETDREFRERQSLEFQANKREASSILVSALESQWPCEVPIHPGRTALEKPYRYINVDGVFYRAENAFKPCYHNHLLGNYFDRIIQAIIWQTRSVEISKMLPFLPDSFPEANIGLVKNGDVFSFPAPESRSFTLKESISPSYSESKQTSRLPSLLFKLEKQAKSEYEKSYVEDLRSSAKSLQDWRSECNMPPSTDKIEDILISHQKDCRAVVNEIYTIMRRELEDSLRDRSASSQHWPRICPTFFLERLSYRYLEDLPDDWKQWIVRYGVAISQLQRALRLLRAVNDESALIKELRNPGHTNWDPLDQPDSLLLEIESDLLIREVQEQIAMDMRSPQSGKNSVMQLNMGEGKSSVIVPSVAAALADGTRLVRVIVGKPQSKQMFQMLVSKLGGLLDRRIYHMPFSRATKVEIPEIHTMQKMFNDCITNGGIFLVQPEHILSFKLMGIECIIAGRGQIGHPLIQLQEGLHSNTRDIVDESDENFSVKFELVYTMGVQQPTEFSPYRWVCIQQLLDVVREVTFKVYSELPGSIERRPKASGSFPWTRIIRPDAADRILSRITEEICAKGLNGFPITRQPPHIRSAVYRYITEAEPNPNDIELVEDESPNAFWTGAKDTLLLLRGMVAGGVLTFAFGHKRWRVDYGLDANRTPTTKLAVPYRAKDSPSPRSEFSHPDVVILLTSLSYYYGGLNDEDLFLTFNHLLKSDQAELEYGQWVEAAKDLKPSFKQLIGINLEDSQCTEYVFENLRYVKEVVDYFLAHMVFAKEMKEFPNKLSASGWDIGEVKENPTTGFSGTNDSRKVLPLHVEQLDLPAQKHTNALVLEYLLQPENSVELMSPHGEMDVSVAIKLLDFITRMEPPTHVILDVGAQILEYDNLEVATKWLQRNSHDAQIQAAVYFDDYDELCVLDRKGHTEPLQTSPYAAQLDSCLIFLDEAHTRGTDLKLPKNYRAAVTLGANLTKDRLVQACMRMRMLGQGQSVVFCVPEEIQAKIRAHRSDSQSPTQSPDDKGISILDILTWTIGETWQDIHRSMGLWANQGRRYEEHLKLWEKAQAVERTDGVRFEKSLAEKYQEDESQTLERRYRPRTRGIEDLKISSDDDDDPISKRCSEFTHLNLNSATLQEEEERELAPEIEQERQEQGPPAAKPDDHGIHHDIRSFVRSGKINYAAQGYRPAFTALRPTTAGTLFEVDNFQHGLAVSMDFERTIKHNHEEVDALDFYQRTIQWILTSGLPNDTVVQHMMVISPFEARKLLPEIHKSNVVALHLYAPRSSLAYRRLDTLDLYTVPERLSQCQIPQRLITELNLFAGQLYFNSYDQYVDACKFMGISYNTSGEGEDIAADGFILRDTLGRVGGESGLPCSPVKFFKVLHTKIRHNCNSISKTHMGKLLDNQLMKPEDFEKDG
ncbi:hypothetical protein F4805DRAFT_420134 [Annulohypoxylon moriforme]|nr:hypothetical protein F4805DRAFT_420134 [Annulohypoxylon moriforme]